MAAANLYRGMSCGRRRHDAVANERGHQFNRTGQFWRQHEKPQDITAGQQGLG